MPLRNRFRRLQTPNSNSHTVSGVINNSSNNASSSTIPSTYQRLDVVNKYDGHADENANQTQDINSEKNVDAGILCALTTKVPAIAAEASAVSNNNAKSNELSRRAIEMAPKCIHYQRNCHIVAPCCGALFGCRICHDDCPVLPPLLQQKMPKSTRSLNGCKYQRVLRTASMPSSLGADDPPEHHTVDRFAISEVICRKCFKKQSSKTNKCMDCGTQFGQYHCAICNLWMSNEEKPYHCPDCGFCRVGGGENFRHCQDCGMCIDKKLFDNHNCKVGKYMSNCPVCQEYLYTSRKACHELPCGHAIHWHCFRELASHDSRCPICKKTAETHECTRSVFHISQNVSKIV